jgi:hypothetical protein
MEVEEIKELLHRHAKLRMPQFQYGVHGEATPTAPAAKIEKLEEYLGDVAIARGDLEEARLFIDHARHALEDTWGRVEGWQQHVAKPNTATGPQIAEAKRKIDPDTYEGIREAKWLSQKLGDQIRRLEKDEEVASRRYTLIVGG